MAVGTGHPIKYNGAELMGITAFLKSEFTKKVLSVIFTKGVLFIFGLGASVLTARMLGPAGKGVYGAAVALGGIGAQFMNLGMHASSQYYISKDKEKMSGIWGNILLLTGAAVIVSILIYFFFTFYKSLTSVSGFMLALACISMPVLLYYMLQQNLFIGLGAVKHFNWLELLSGALFPVLLGATALFTIIVPQSVMTLSLIASIISLSVGAILLRWKFKFIPSPSLSLFLDVLPYGLKSYLACLGSYLVTRLNILLISAMLGDIQTGLYTTALSLADSIYMIPLSFGMLILPTAAAMESDAKRCEFMKKTLLTLSVVMTVIACLAAVLSKFVIGLLFGNDFLESSRVFNILMIGTVFMSLQGALSNYFAAKNKWTGNIITPFVGLALSLVLNILFIPTYGINGAAAVSVVTYTIMFLFMIGRFIFDSKAVLNDQQDS